MRAAALIVGACVAATGVYALWPRGDAASPGQADSSALSGAAGGTSAGGASHASLAAAPVGNGMPSRTPLSALPASAVDPALTAAGQTLAAGTAPDATPPPLSAADKAANDALRQLGYFIDERYYKMGLDALRKAAATQDVQALTHLAERYMFEFNGHPQAQGYEPGFQYMQAARDALQAAYLLGNRHAAAMLSESYLMERQPVDATAWNLVAQRSGDQLSADWFLTTDDYQRLTDVQRQQATQAANRLWAALQAKKPAGT